MVFDNKSEAGRRLLVEVRRWMDQWGLQPEGPPIVKARNLVWPVTDGQSPLILKLVDPSDDEAQSAALLRAWDGCGAVRLVMAEGHVLLMERAAGTGSLERMVLDGRDDAATAIVCDVVGQLHRVDLHLPELIPMDRRVASLGYTLERESSRPLLQRACHLATGLLDASRTDWRMLHGDIHHSNILGSARGWLAIDPKGVSGPRAYEYCNCLCNPYPHTALVALPERMARQAAIIAERAGLDRTDLLRWTLVHAALAVAWSDDPEEVGHWTACLETVAGLIRI